MSKKIRPSLLASFVTASKGAAPGAEHNGVAVFAAHDHFLYRAPGQFHGRPGAQVQ